MRRKPNNSRQSGFLDRLFEAPARLLERLAATRPARRAAIDPVVEREKIEAVAELLRSSGRENIGRRVETLLVFDNLIIVELGRIARDGCVQLLLVQYFSRFDSFRVDWRERAGDQAVRLGLADFETPEQAATFVEQCVTKYLQATEVPDSCERATSYVIPTPPPLRVPRN